MQNENDAELVAAERRSGDGRAFAVLVQRHYRSAYRRALAIVGDWSEAEDVMQDALVKAYLHLDQLQEAAKFGGWLQSIVVTSALMSLRRKIPETGRSANIDGSGAGTAGTPYQPEESAAPVDELLAAERSRAVHDAIRSLPEKYQQPVRLFHLNGCSYKSIAHILNLPLGTVQSLLNRARKKLQPLLNAYGTDTFCCL